MYNISLLTKTLLKIPFRYVVVSRNEILICILIMATKRQKRQQKEIVTMVMMIAQIELFG
jgi:hypothetical protein